MGNSTICSKCGGTIDFHRGTGPCTCSLFEKAFNWLKYNKIEHEN